MAAPERTQTQELLDEESLAVLAILLAVSLEFGFGFAKTVDWWAGLIAGPTALASLVTLFRLRRTHVWLVRAATWVVRGRCATTHAIAQVELGEAHSRNIAANSSSACTSASS